MMKVPNLNILDEKNKILRTVSKEVVFPLSSEDEKLIFDAIKYLELSQDDKIAEKYDLRAGMGLAFVQLGVPKRIFVIANKNEDDTFEEHIVINPVIKSASEELVYVGEGEGCLSINRPTTGIVPRHARVNVEYQDIKGNKQTPGGTCKDVTDIMIEYGAVNACNMDGGSSTIMVYRDTYGLFGEAGTVQVINSYSLLQERPRKMPTFWMVAP